jgi:hypothetical protein
MFQDKVQCDICIWLQSLASVMNHESPRLSRALSIWEYLIHGLAELWQQQNELLWDGRDWRRREMNLYVGSPGIHPSQLWLMTKVVVQHRRRILPRIYVV